MERWQTTVTLKEKGVSCCAGRSKVCRGLSVYCDDSEEVTKERFEFDDNGSILAK